MNKRYKMKSALLITLFCMSAVVTFVFALWLLIGLISVNAGRDASSVSALTWILLVGTFIGSLAFEAILIGLLKGDRQ